MARRNFVKVLIAMAIAAAIFMVVEYRRHSRLVALHSALTEAGGRITFPGPIWQVLWQRWTGRPADDLSILGIDERATIDGSWLRSHGNLREFQIDGMYVVGCKLTGDELAQLVLAHSPQGLTTWSIPNMDAVAAALGKMPTITNLVMQQSDLTDAGFRQLPLEQLHILQVPNTKVTPAGLLELRRAGELQHVVLDGLQVDAKVVHILNTLPKIESVSLRGPMVTDETLRLFHGTTLNEIAVSEASVTKFGADSLKASSPECFIHTADGSILE